MKVCSDACLFGAWVAEQLSRTTAKPKTVLDIGTGTGLLALMIAQKTQATIHAVELDENAFLQAVENFKASPWSTRLTAHHADVTGFLPRIAYDIIISNPPFYEQSLRSKDEQKNKAKHSGSLSYEGLAGAVANKLSTTGKFYVLLPYASFNSFTAKAAEHGLFPQELVYVKQTTTHNFFRVMAVFSFDKTSSLREQTITIKSGNNYDPEFVTLLKDYYLYL
ncbi:methyltransferase domain-containing protein [Segetibacter sp. 3557_3]|uniref:tRNA1(Val) (adenine(37)-N6)-methyltransferase n=1 Tax=Segetibacter sp. 3557_3 TaxID=2547429 RepID=UPI001058CF37|nr:methyltransferase [Segetibacter sp. 3557_3]TDH27245.1 methyltransferase domain-containing protein [Segetibacter sp. 3557_3]